MIFPAVLGLRLSEREDTAGLETGRVGAELRKGVVAGNGRREVPGHTLTCGLTIDPTQGKRSRW